MNIYSIDYNYAHKKIHNIFTLCIMKDYKNKMIHSFISELPKDYSYPRLPADPVSLTLAYRNIFSPINVAYNKKVRFVPEDKLSFGHRTIPNETPSSKKKLDVPEEKLQILDKPVVELKPIPAVPITITYNEQEEAKLAELEAIERERIHQEEVAEQQQEHFITYG